MSYPNIDGIELSEDEVELAEDMGIGDYINYEDDMDAERDRNYQEQNMPQ